MASVENKAGVDGSVARAGRLIVPRTDIQNGLTNCDVVTTPLLIKLLFLASPEGRV